MAEPILCVSWNDHASELTRVWKTLLENNSFVDCTIAAEGKSLKAHRLILSACSPYFQMVFNEENEKYPIVILRDTSFHMLKTLIDFVYNGKVEILTSQLETFLDLAVSLQIKGLNNYLHKNRAINILGNASSGEIHQCSSRVNQDNSRVENSRTSYEENLSNCSQQCHFHFSQDNSNSTQTVLPVLFEGSHDSAEVRQSRAAMMPVQNHQSHHVHCNPDVVVNTEQNLKQHLFCEIKIVETKKEVFDNVIHVESMSGNPEGEMNHESALSFEENLDQYSNGRESLHLNGNSALVLRQQQLQEEQLQQEKQLQQVDEQQKQRDVPHSVCELSSPPELSEQNKQILPELSVPLSVKANDSESEESTNALDVPGNDTEEMDEEIELTCEESIDPSSGEEYIPPDEGKRRRGRRRGRRPQQSDSSLAPLERQAPAYGAAVTLTGSQKRKRSGGRRHPCRVCEKTFPFSSTLSVHMRTHTGERPFVCDVCGKAFTLLSALAPHMRTHTGERPFTCDVCGKSFAQSVDLVTHIRTHTGERPYVCEVCGKAFSQSNTLISHKRRHTGDRPYPCDVCGRAFKQSGTLSRHKRRHTGERPYACDVCGMTFTRSTSLINHKRRHTGERPYVCEVCGKTFSQSNNLLVHTRTHTRASEERTFNCSACARSFPRKRDLVAHLRSCQPPPQTA